MFSDWFLDPETTLELASIQRLTGCNRMEALAVFQRFQANERLEALEMVEWAAFENESDWEEGE